ncbi:MAG: hypothetical protein H6934_12495 [Burkholderiaceae bacterium]|nr:hypothetical protein [Burkholderiaceae bacterium]
MGQFHVAQVLDRARCFPMEVDADFGNDFLGGSCGCRLLTGFTPLSSERFLALRQQLAGLAVLTCSTVPVGRSA